MVRARRYRLPLSVCMLGVDHFKLINDGYHHETVGRGAQDAGTDPPGEHVKDRSCSALRRGRVRDRASEYRKKDAYTFAERLRAAVEQARITEASASGANVSTTASLGVAKAVVGEHDDKELLRRANRALYEAKHASCNRVVAYQVDGGRARGRY